MIVLEVPDLATDRFALRPWTTSDASALVAAWEDPAIQEGSTPPEDRSLGAAQRWIEGVEVRRRAGVALDLAIATPDGQVVGEVGLSGFDANRRAAIMGWWVHAEARGAGIATDAVTLVREWVLGPGRLRAVMAEVDPANLASVTVAERAGFHVIDDTRNPQEPARGRGPRVWYVAFSTVK